MSFRELQEKVLRFEVEQRLHKATEKFARYFATLFVIVGTVLATLGVFITQIYKSKELAKADMWPLTDIWSKIVSLFENQDMPFLTKLLVIVLSSIAFAVLLTVLYFFCAKAILGTKKPKEAEETLGNAKDLLKHFENIKPTYESNTAGEVRIHFLCFFVSFLAIAVTQQQVKGPDKAYLVGFLCAILTTIAFAIFRAIFILIVKVCWKENVALESEIKTELQTTINYLNRKEKEKIEKLKSEQLEKEKKENLERAESLFEKFKEEESDDINELYKIAMLGHHDATLLLAEWCMAQAGSPELTRAEQKALFQMMYEALVMVGKYDEHSNITKFLYYSTLMGLGKIKNVRDAQEALNELRQIKRSGDLSEMHTELCTESIEALVKFINKRS